MKIDLSIEPCKICNCTEYGFVPYSCNENNMSFRVICTGCGYTNSEIYEIEINKNNRVNHLCNSCGLLHNCPIDTTNFVLIQCCAHYIKGDE